MIQGSPEWRAARAGKITASCFQAVMAKVKTGEASTRRDYRWQLLTERLTGSPVEGYSNKAMEWGTAHEAEARAEYEAETGELAHQVGIIIHPRHPMIACSPDFLIGAKGGGEIKCPYSSVVHVQTLKGGMPPEHRPQVQGGMWCSERDWWDFVSYDPRMPEGLRLYIERIKRDDAYIAELEAECLRFESEIQRDLDGLLLLRKAA